MWKYIRIFLPLLVIGFVAPMIMPGPDGKPVMSLEDWLPDKTTVSKISSTVKKVVGALDQTIDQTIDQSESASNSSSLFSAQKNKIYKWRDNKGRWQFTDRLEEVPEYALPQVQAEQMPRAVNSMAAPPKVEASAAAASDLPMAGGELGIGKLPQLVDEAKKAKALMEQRNEKLDQL